MVSPEFLEVVSKAGTGLRCIRRYLTVSQPQGSLSNTPEGKVFFNKLSAMTVGVWQWHCCVSPCFPNVTWRVNRCLTRRRLPADVRTAVYAVGAQTHHGWDFLLSKYRLHSFHLEKNNIEFALSLSKNEDKLQWWVVTQEQKRVWGKFVNIETENRIIQRLLSQVLNLMAYKMLYRANTARGSSCTFSFLYFGAGGQCIQNLQ